MPEPDPRKPRRALKNLPPDRFQPKMLFFWLALVAAVLALLWFPNQTASNPEALTIQDVLERAEAGNINRDSGKAAVIRSDPSNGRDWMIIVGQSRRDANSPYRDFRAAGRVTENIHERLAKTKRPPRPPGG